MPLNIQQNKITIRWITAISLLIPLAVTVLMLLPGRAAQGSLSGLPLFHAILNGTTAVFLITGFFFIRRGKIARHKFCMLSAFALSCIFLISYVVYHYHTGHTPYGGKDSIRAAYFFILITHISLAVTIVPLALLAITRALSGNISGHKKIVKWTFPFWLYVAITGVVVYLMMKPYYRERQDDAPVKSLTGEAVR